MQFYIKGSFNMHIFFACTNDESLKIICFIHASCWTYTSHVVVCDCSVHLKGRSKWWINLTLKQDLTTESIVLFQMRIIAMPNLATALLNCREELVSWPCKTLWVESWSTCPTPLAKLGLDPPKLSQEPHGRAVVKRYMGPPFTSIFETVRLKRWTWHSFWSSGLSSWSVRKVYIYIMYTD